MCNPDTSKTKRGYSSAHGAGKNGGRKSGARAMLLKFGRKSRKYFNRLMIGSSVLGDPETFRREDFPWLEKILANLGDVQAEAKHLLAFQERLPGVEEISPDHSRIALGKRWRSVFLHAYGYRSEAMCSLCPRTAALVDAIPGIETAFFSVMTPNAHLPAHKGVTKAIITCHVPLLVPRDNERCWIRLNQTRHHWHVGEPFVFDDTREHEVRNDTEDLRVVLLIHVRRPLRFPGSMAGKFFMWAVKASPFIKDGVRNQQAWERRFMRMQENHTEPVT